MAVEQKLYTAADLWEMSHLPEYADKRLELVEGEIIEMNPSAGGHGLVVSKIDRLIRVFAEQNQLGETTGAETGFLLQKNPIGKDTVRAPDVGFIAAGRLSSEMLKGYIPLAPDLAVEVVSEYDTATEIIERVSDFLRAGTRMVWVFYPKPRTAVVHTPYGSRTIDSDGVLDGGDVLPGFSVPVSEVFSVLK